MMNRRQFLKGLAQVSTGYVLAGMGLHQYSSHIEASDLTVERVDIPIPGLGADLVGFRIVQLSDIHLDSHTQPELVAEAVETANLLQPDLILLTGDYITDSAEAIFDLTPVLARLKAQYGVFACRGNHEMWTNPALIDEALRQVGISVLVNEGITIRHGQDALFVVGLDDLWSGKPDLAVALANYAEGTPVVLMAHEPDFADQICLDGRVSLQLSGHSHGGQVRLPGMGAIILPEHGQKYDQGLFRVEDMWVYTNRGLGASPVPYRLNCPPEVTEFTLRA